MKLQARSLPGLIALLCLLLIPLCSLILLLSVPAEASPRWDEAYYLWASKRFSNFLTREGPVGLLRHYRSPKPWLMELLYLPLNLLDVRSIRLFLLAPMAAYLVGAWVVFKAAAQRYSLAAAAAIATLYAAVYRYRVFSVSTQTEAFCFLGLTLLLLVPLMKCAGWKRVTGIASGVALLLLAKQSHIIFVAVGAVPALLVASRENRWTTLLGVILGGALVAPVYLLDYAALLAYARNVDTMTGEPVSQCLRIFFVDSMGPLPLIGLALLLLGMASLYRFERPHIILAWVGGLALWLVVYSTIISHNNFKYISPVAVPFMLLPFGLYSGERRTSNSKSDGRLLPAALMGAGSLVAMTWWSIGPWPLLAMGFSARDYGSPRLSAVLGEHGRRHGPGLHVHVIGDHAFQNYSNMSWLLELEHVDDYHVHFIPPGVEPLEPVNSGDLLVFVGIHDVLQLVPAEPMRASLDNVRKKVSLVQLVEISAGAGDHVDVFSVEPRLATQPAAATAGP